MAQARMHADFAEDSTLYAPHPFSFDPAQCPSTQHPGQAHLLQKHIFDRHTHVNIKVFRCNPLLTVTWHKYQRSLLCTVRIRRSFRQLCDHILIRYHLELPLLLIAYRRSRHSRTKHLLNLVRLHRL